MKLNTSPMLIVDDDMISRQILQEHLSSLGYSSVQCEGGESAIRLLNKEVFSIVLLDLNMPEVNGFAVLEHIKSLEDLSHIPVIIISGTEDEEEVVRCIEMGAEDTISKPFNSIMLNARIKNAMAKNDLRNKELQHARQIETLATHSSNLLHATQSSSGDFRNTRPDHAGILVCGINHFPDCRKRIPLDSIESQRKELIASMRKVCTSFSLEEISTSNSCFIFLCKPSDQYSSLERHIVKCGLELLACPNSISEYWTCRVGIHAAKMNEIKSHKANGKDPWSEMITTAARIESVGAQDAINISDNIWDVVREDFQKNQDYITIAVRGELSLHQIHTR